MDPIVGGEWGEDPNASDDGIEIPVVRVANISGLDVAVDELTLRRVKESKLSGRIIGARSLLIEKSGGGEKQAVGRVVLGRKVPNRSICSNFMAKADCGSKVDPLFVAYLLNSAYSSGLNEAHIQQTTGIQNLRVADYLNTHLAIPPLPEQRAIAAYLDRSCAAIDAAIAAKRGQIESLADIRKSLLQRVVTCGREDNPALIATGNSWLEKIPRGWSLVMLKRLATIQGGITLGKDYSTVATVEYPYLRVANVQDGYVDLADVTRLDVPPSIAAGVMLQAGDVLMTEGGDLDKLGRGTVWEGQIAPCLHQNHVFAVRCLEHKLLPSFLAYVTASQYGRDYFEATGKRTTNLAATNATKVGMFYIPLPSLAEQHALVAYLDEELGRLTRIEKTIAQQIDTLLAYRKSLIHEYVTGKRRLASADFTESQSHA
ncbi:MAG: restriction endonuclease subunit S [Rhodocyclaceae bacterium]|nr:restriction endonuclease subunit S [Rhodocyclaceae bacterium]